MLLCLDPHVLRKGPSGDRLLDLLEQVLSVLVLPGGGRVSGNVLDSRPNEDELLVPKPNADKVQSN